MWSRASPGYGGRYSNRTRIGNRRCGGTQPGNVVTRQGEHRERIWRKGLPAGVSWRRDEGRASGRVRCRDRMRALDGSAGRDNGMNTLNRQGRGLSREEDYVDYLLSSRYPVEQLDADSTGSNGCSWRDPVPNPDPAVEVLGPGRDSGRDCVDPALRRRGRWRRGPASRPSRGRAIAARRGFPGAPWIAFQGRSVRG